MFQVREREEIEKYRRKECEKEERKSKFRKSDAREMAMFAEGAT